MKPVVIIKMAARSAGITREAKSEFPFEDGVYPFANQDYPLTRFDGITVRGDTVCFDGDIFGPENQTLTTEKHFIAYGVDRYAWDETVNIKFLPKRGVSNGYLSKMRRI